MEMRNLSVDMHNWRQRLMRLLTNVVVILGALQWLSETIEAAAAAPSSAPFGTTSGDVHSHVAPEYIVENVIDMHIEVRSGLAAQSIISNSSDILWFSYTSYLLRGNAVVDDSGTLIDFSITARNDHALDGPRQVFSNYSHIGDGCYVPPQHGDGAGELWFGIEGNNWPRKANAAVVVYDAETLEFKGLIPSDQLVLAWFAVSPKSRIGFTSVWTGATSLNRLDLASKTWLDELPLLGEDGKTIRGGLDYIQGGTFEGSHLYLISDDVLSTLYRVNVDSGRIRVVQQTGLGNEREGLTNFRGDLLSLGNRWHTWEPGSSSTLHVLRKKGNSVGRQGPTLSSAAAAAIAFLGVSLVICLLVLFRWHMARRRSLYAAQEGGNDMGRLLDAFDVDSASSSDED